MTRKRKGNHHNAIRYMHQGLYKSGSGSRPPRPQSGGIVSSTTLRRPLSPIDCAKAHISWVAQLVPFCCFGS